MAGGVPQAILLDTNVFVAAVRHPLRHTTTFRFLVSLLVRDDIRLVANEVLAEEYIRYAKALPSPTASALLSALLARMTIVRVEDRFLAACAPFLRSAAASDRVHAATCLQEGAVLVSNDRDFEPLREAGIIEVRTVTEALRRWPPRERR